MQFLLNKLIKPRAHSEPRLFIHIPKTAGTSFRSALEERCHVLSDYGHQQTFTSEIIEKHVYEQPDLYSLKKELDNQDSWLCGHFWLNKYSGIFSPENMVTVLRNPVERVMSHYNHQRRWSNKKYDSLSSFLAAKEAQNTQSRFLSNLPISLIGVVGITEEFDQSIAIVNREFQVSLEVSRKNVNDNKEHDFDELTATELEQITKLNKQDIDIYKHALALQNERLALIQEDKPWTYLYARITNQNEIKGIAFRRKSSEPINIRIEAEGKAFFSALATDYVTDFGWVKLCRERFVGFSAKLPVNYAGGGVTIFCEDTQQKFHVK